MRTSAAPPATPLVRLPRLGQELGIDLWAKRDDLFPAPGGGNKARRIGPIADEAAQHGGNALVATGGLQSNHARAVALEAARRGWPCTLVLHGDPARLAQPTGNLLLDSLAGAQVRIVAPSEIASAIGAALQELRDQGHTPWEAPVGYCLAGSMAYVEAASELADQCRQVGWWPDAVVITCATGGTQAGLVAGFQRLGVQTRVIGISIARPNPRGATIVQAAYEELCAALAMPCQPQAVEVCDEWIGDGYERPTEATFTAIRTAAMLEGLILDPTYTGKAFGGFMEMAKRGDFAATPSVLFWHTGGLLNLLASGCAGGRSPLP